MPSKPKTWFFLRGLVRETSHWGDFLKQFQSAFPEDSIYCFDLPGNGRKYLEKSPLSLSQSVDLLRKEARNAGLGENSYFLTLSLGGMVGLQWLQMYPEDFKGLVLINSSSGSLNPFWERLQTGAWFEIVKILLQRSSEKREKIILKLTSNVRSKIYKDWGKIFEWHPVSHLNALRQLISAGLFKVPDSPPPIPILALRSLGDHLVDPKCSETLAKHWGLPLETHPTAGHDLPLDAPGWVIEQIQKWLKHFPEEP